MIRSLPHRSRGALIGALFAAGISLAGCSREAAPEKSAASPNKTAEETSPVNTTDFAKLYGIVADPDMPDSEKMAFLNHWDKVRVRWDGFLGNQATSGEFMLYPTKNAVGGIRIAPPQGYTKILQDLNRLTPLRITGTLAMDYNGLHLDATSLDILPDQPAATPAGAKSDAPR